MIADGPLPLPGSFLRRNPAGETEPRNGRGLVAVMEGPFEDRGRSLDLDNAAGQSQDLIAKWRAGRAAGRPGRSVNGTDLDERAFGEYRPPAPAELQAPPGHRRHAYLPPARQARLLPVDDPEPAPDTPRLPETAISAHDSHPPDTESRRVSQAPFDRIGKIVGHTGQYRLVPGQAQPAISPVAMVCGPKSDPDVFVGFPVSPDNARMLPGAGLG